MDEIKDSKVLNEALDRFDCAKDFERPNRLLAEEDFRFVCGEGQWPDQVRQEREQAGQPCLTINRLPVFIAQVMGDARQNRPAIKISPVDDNTDIETAEVIEGIIRHIESDSDADVAYLTALQHACEGGFGHWRILTDYSSHDSFDQDIKIQRITNPFSVYWDDNSTHVCKADAEWCFVTEWLTTEAFDRQYPKAKDEVRDWESDITANNLGHWYDSDKGVRVAEYWRKTRKAIKISMLADGSIVEGEIEGAEKVRDSYRVEIERFVLSGDKVLEGPEKWPGTIIPIVSVFGPEEFNDGYINYRSIIRHAKDPARMNNYWQSAITEKIALAPKVPYTGTVENFQGLEQFWQDANKSTKAYLPFNADPQNPSGPRRTEAAAVNVAEIQQANQAVDDLKATIGIFDASLGASGNETSGRAIIARQREGDTATFAWIDNLSRAIEHTGRILIDLIPHIYDTQRVIRILGEDDSEQLVTVNETQIIDPLTQAYQVANDLSVGKYDVRVSVGPSYATRRMEAADSMMAFVQAFPQSAGVIGDLIAKNMDWPGAEDIAKRLRKTMPPELIDEELTPEEQQARQQQMKEAQDEQMVRREMEMKSFAKSIEKIEAEVAEIRSKAVKNVTDSAAQELETTVLAQPGMAEKAKVTASY